MHVLWVLLSVKYVLNRWIPLYWSLSGEMLLLTDDICECQLLLNLHFLTYISSLCLLCRFNRLSVDSVDESSFAHLSYLQVLDIGTANTDLPFERDNMEGDMMMEEEQET